MPKSLNETILCVYLSVSFIQLRLNFCNLSDVVYKIVLVNYLIHKSDSSAFHGLHQYHTIYFLYLNVRTSPMSFVLFDFTSALTSRIRAINLST